MVHSTCLSTEDWKRNWQIKHFLNTYTIARSSSEKLQFFLCKTLLSISICQSTLLSSTSSSQHLHLPSIARTQAPQFFQRVLASPSPWIFQGECLSSQSWVLSLPGWWYISACMAMAIHPLRSSTPWATLHILHFSMVHWSSYQSRRHSISYIHKNPKTSTNHEVGRKICRNYRRLSVETCLKHQELSFLFARFATFPFLWNAITFCSLTRGSHDIPQHHPTSPNNPQQLSVFWILEALSASNGKCHFEGQRDSSSSLSSVARMLCGDKAGKVCESFWKVLSSIYTTLLTILLQVSLKSTANLSPGSHLTLSHGHQLICDHFRDNLRSRQRSQPGGKMDIQAVFGWYTRGGVGRGWRGDLTCSVGYLCVYSSSSHSYFNPIISLYVCS